MQNHIFTNMNIHIITFRPELGSVSRSDGWRWRGEITRQADEFDIRKMPPANPIQCIKSLLVAGLQDCTARPEPVRDS